MLPPSRGRRCSCIAIGFAPYLTGTQSFRWYYSRWQQHAERRDTNVVLHSSHSISAVCSLSFCNGADANALKPTGMRSVGKRYLNGIWTLISLWGRRKHLRRHGDALVFIESNRKFLGTTSAIAVDLERVGRVAYH